MKGFITVYQSEKPVVVALSSIVKVSAYDADRTRIELNMGGKSEKIFVTPNFDKVKELMENASGK